MTVAHQRRDHWIALALALLLLGLGATRMGVEACGTFLDDAVYVSTARALAQGEGYRLTGLPGAPRQTRYPVLFPALLAVAWWLWPSFPANLLLMKGLVLLAGAAALALSYLYLVRFSYVSRGIALGGALACATSPFLLYFATQVLSEMPCALALVVVLWLLEAERQRPSSSRARQFLVGCALAAPFLIRTATALVGPLGLVALRRAGKPVRWVALGLVLTSLPWLLWSALGGVSDPTTTPAYYAGYLGWWLSAGKALLHVMWCNLLEVNVFTATVGLDGLGLALSSLWAVGWFWLALFLGLGLWLGLFLQLREGRPLVLALIAVVLPLFVWPWPPARFFVPMLLLLVPQLLRALSVPLTRWIPRGAQRPALACALAVLLAGNLLGLAGHVRVSRRNGYPLFEWAAAPAAWPSYLDLFAWIRRRTPPEAVVAAGFDGMVHLYSERRALRPFFARPAALHYGLPEPPLGTVEELRHALEAHHVGYLVLLPMPQFAEEPHFARLVEELRARRPGWLVSVYRGADPRFEIFAVRSAGSAIPSS